MLFALQNGSYGSKLFSSDYTPQENMRIVEAGFALNNKRHHLLRSSVDRYERIHNAYQDIMGEISKRMNSKDFPDTILPIHLLVRQVAQSQDPSTPTRSLKRSRSSSVDSVGSNESVSGGGPALPKPLKPAPRRRQGRKQIPIRIPCVRERHRRLTRFESITRCTVCTMIFVRVSSFALLS